MQEKKKRGREFKKLGCRTAGAGGGGRGGEAVGWGWADLPSADVDSFKVRDSWVPLVGQLQMGHRKESWPLMARLKKFFNSYIYILFFAFLGPHLWHMEVPRLGV